MQLPWQWEKELSLEQREIAPERQLLFVSLGLIDGIGNDRHDEAFFLV